MAKGSDKMILIVDDDEDLADLLAFVLTAEGYSVETAPDGRKALEAVQREMPSLILLDMKMPVMNGWEFAAEFQARYNRAVPIVVVTAAENAQKRADEIGASGWISKPFDVGTLVAVVRQQLAA